jgi:hypothetical protein
MSEEIAEINQAQRPSTTKPLISCNAGFRPAPTSDFVQAIGDQID